MGIVTIEAGVIRSRDTEIAQSFDASRYAARESIEVPGGKPLTPEEERLANWISEYAKTAGLSFRDAMDHVFDYLRRSPKERGEVYGSHSEFSEFAEVSPRAVRLPLPAGWKCSQEGLEHLRRLRLYQAATGCEFAEAVAVLQRD